MTLRLIEVMCRSHAEQAEYCWPIAGDLFALFRECPACSLVADSRTGGTIAIRSLPDLDHGTYEYATALHEGAHAVLGIDAGMPLNFAQIEPRTDDLQTGHGGCVNWGDYSVPLESWAAMVWAGQRAQRRWLSLAGLDTSANRVDVSNLGWDDTKRVLEAAPMHGLPESVGWDLCANLLDRHWTAIERVADTLLAHGRLTGVEVVELAGFGCGVR